MSEEKKIAEMDKQISDLKKEKEALKVVPEKAEPAPPKKEPPKKKPEFEGGINITWIDNRYHINGIHGIPGGNKITVRSLEAVDRLIKHLGYAREAFDQEEMINTKKEK